MGFMGKDRHVLVVNGESSDPALHGWIENFFRRIFVGDDGLYSRKFLRFAYIYFLDIGVGSVAENTFSEKGVRNFYIRSVFNGAL